MILQNNTTIAFWLGAALATFWLFNSANVKASDHASLISPTIEVSRLAVDDVESLMSKPSQLIVMWSLECPACFDELETIAQLLKQSPDLAITLISTDDDPSRINEVNEVYTQFAFRNITRLVYAANQSQKLRYTIDPTWQGELPRSFYIDANGKGHGYSGLLNEKKLHQLISLIK